MRRPLRLWYKEPPPPPHDPKSPHLHHHHHSRFYHPHWGFLLILSGVALQMWVSVTQLSALEVPENNLDVPLLPAFRSTREDSSRKTPASTSAWRLYVGRVRYGVPVSAASYTWEAQPPRVVRLAHDGSYQHPIPSSRNRVARRNVAELGNASCTYCQYESDQHLWDFEKPFYEDCTPMAKWQTIFYPTCNVLHEITMMHSEEDYDPKGHDLADESVDEIEDDDDDTVPSIEETTLLSMQGSWRSVWKYQDAVNDTAVLKVLKHSREFDHESFAYHITDAIVMERLTSSPHIINAYGFCGQSVLTEFASGSARKLIKDPKFNSKERLKMGRDLARALTAMHSIDFPNSTNPTLAHNDINIANAVEVDGRIKLNDFNLAVLMRWNDTQPCGYPVRFDRPMWESPEDVRNLTYVDPALGDVYSLGNLLFSVLTTRQPWLHLEPNGPYNKTEVAQMKTQGIMPAIPDKYLESRKMAHHALYFAIQAAYRDDPAERLSSHELAEALGIALNWGRDGRRASRTDLAMLFVKPRPDMY